MEHKPTLARASVRTAPRAPRERRCSRNGTLTAPIDSAIRLVSEAAEPAPERGRVEVVETYFDASGRPAKRKSLGAARVARSYDAHGNQVEEAYFNAEGKPTERKGLGAARISWRYDESGNQVEAALFSADGAPIRRTRGRGKRAVEPA